jgi:hypothetical protein
VTGHRPDPAKGRPVPDLAKLRATIREVLEHIGDAVRGVALTHGASFDTRDGETDRSHLRVVSALAEGADLWVTDEALKLGYELQCPLPFSREDYAEDFVDPASRQEFRDILRRASAVFELDGEIHREQGVRKPADAAYEAVGSAVLNQTDLLVAVWDGKPAQGRGGTATVVEQALIRGVPVVWVVWSSPETWLLRLPEWRLVQKPADMHGDTERLKTQVRDLLLPPELNDAAESSHATTTTEEYFNEPQKRGNILHGWWSVFLWLVTGELFGTKRFKQLLSVDPFRVRNFENKTREEWDKESKGSLLDTQQKDPDRLNFAAALETPYLAHYAWANELSIYYANLYRSAFVVSYFLAAVAVFLALIGLVAGLPEDAVLILTLLELSAIVTILVLTSYGRRRRWHERSIDYRMLSERLRLARCLALLGGGGQQVSIPAHLATYGNPSATWMHWHYQAIERAAGLPNVRLSMDYLMGVQNVWLKNVIEDQIVYHKTTYVRYEQVHERLHSAGWALFVLTLMACSLHLLNDEFIRNPAASRWLVLATAFLPALSAALIAIRSQAEAQRLAMRSRAMEQNLEQIRRDFAALPTRAGEGDSQRLRAGADRVTDLMVREMLDWRVVLLDRPLETHI